MPGAIPAYEARLLADANAAAAELGIDASGPKIVALKNTLHLHHLVVCTLCSCYPRVLLGLPPAWYKSAAYRSRAVNEPRQVLAEFGTSLAPDVELRVVDSTADCRYLVAADAPGRNERLERGEAGGPYHPGCHDRRDAGAGERRGCRIVSAAKS